MTALAAEMVQVGKQATAEIRAEISGVRYCADGITFWVRERSYTAALKGRNADLVLGGSAEADQSIALRCMLDGDAFPSGHEMCS